MPTILQPIQMRRALAAAAVLGSNGCRPLRRPGSSPVAPDAPHLTEQHVKATFHAIARADTQALSGLLSDCVRWISPTSGAVLSKPQLLVAAARMPAGVTIRYVVDSIRIWRSGSTAAAEYRLSDSRVFEAQTNTFTSRGLDLFGLESRIVSDLA